MKQLKWMLNGALVTFAFSLVIFLTILVISELQIVRADVVVRLEAPTATQQEEFLPLTNAKTHRDVTVQRFAPLEVK
jgi:ABC-type nickel/cobalt efflux system permease component RcnA